MKKIEASPFKIFSVSIFLFLMSACSHEPRKINFGKDNCDFCKMTIMDDKYPAQLISKKGKSFIFDDVQCLVSFLKNGGVWSNEIEHLYFYDAVNKGNWIPAENVFFLRSDEFKSPMGGNCLAYSKESDRNYAATNVVCKKLSWEDLHAGK